MEDDYQSVEAELSWKLQLSKDRSTSLLLPVVMTWDQLALVQTGTDGSPGIRNQWFWSGRGPWF